MFLSALFEEENQEDKDYILWGTPMPIKVMLGGAPVLVVAKGSCSMKVVDQEIFVNEVGVQNNMISYTRPLIIHHLTEGLLEFTRQMRSFDELEQRLDHLADEVLRRLRNDVKKLGLEVLSFKIHTVGHN